MKYSHSVIRIPHHMDRELICTLVYSVRKKTSFLIGTTPNKSSYHIHMTLANLVAW